MKTDGQAKAETIEPKRLVEPRWNCLKRTGTDDEMEMKKETGNRNKPRCGYRYMAEEKKIYISLTVQNEYK